MSDLLQQFVNHRPQGGARVILADPPWLFENYSAKGEVKNPLAHYDCMDIDAVNAMPVSVLAADDCALFLWVTWPTLPVWMDVLNHWGFKYSGLAWEWIKYNPVTDKYAFGTGYGTRKNLEPCLLATRGNPSVRSEISSGLFGIERTAEGAHSVRDFIQAMPLDCIRAPRREHSRKPEEQYARIETLFDGPYVELFARHQRKGWTSLGNQTDKFGDVS
tara:strand:+ start:1424 stop:2077 length:654 start_codon:yes stop_codon:yes gene_type:complete